MITKAPISNTDKKAILGRTEDLLEISVIEAEQYEGIIDLANSTNPDNLSRALVLATVSAASSVNKLVQIQALDLRYRLLAEHEAPRSLLATRGPRE